MVRVGLGVKQSCLFVSHGLGDLQMLRLISSQRWVIWELVSQIAALKVGVLNVHLWEKLRVEGSILNRKLCTRGCVVWYECFSDFPTLFSVGIFSVTECIGVTQLIFVFLSEGIDPCVVVYSVCL